MKKYFIIIPKNEVTEEMKSEFIDYRDCNNNDDTMGIVCGNLSEIFNSYTVLSKEEYHKLLGDEPEKWVHPSIRN